MEGPLPGSDLERRKQVRLRIRSDLEINPQKYEGRTYYVVKDPVSLRYYRFEEQEHFLIRLMNGTATLDHAQKEFEKRFRPKRLTLEDLESFGQQLLTAGLAHNESPKAGSQLFDRRKKRRRTEWMQMLTNILYIKIPLYDPDRLLRWMLKNIPPVRWIFTQLFFTLSCGLWAAAILLVLTHFEQFRDRLPSYHEFFNLKTVANLWIALGVVKVIHEFGHGLSCRYFGGEVHEMGALFLCLSPCLYCNVSDAWTLPNKWWRIVISFAGIYVELVIAAIATFVWWNSASYPFINHLSLSLMVVCSVSTVVFNANPLMRFDGYYVMADWLEIPNLRDRSNRFLKNLFLEHCLGVEVQPEPYMTTGRMILFTIYAVISYVYRWVVTVSILYFLYQFLEPKKLGALSHLLAIAAGASLVGWPLFRMGKAIHKRGRLPDMKPRRVTVTATVAAILVLAFFLVPLPVARIRQVGLIEVKPDKIEKVMIQVPGGAILDRLHVRDGDRVTEGQILAEFSSVEMQNQLEEARSQANIRVAQVRTYHKQLEDTSDAADKARISSLLAVAESERRSFLDQARAYEGIMGRMVLRAPREGVVMTCPHVDEVGKQWEKDQATPFCSIGEWGKIRVLVPVKPADFRLMKHDLSRTERLQVVIRVQGRAGDTWEGEISNPLPESEAKEIPVQLTSKAGGPLAEKPPQPGQNMHVPQDQQYLVGVNFKDADNFICPGSLAQVKIQCQWRPGAWWVWRWISSTFDLGLI